MDILAQSHLLEDEEWAILEDKLKRQKEYEDVIQDYFESDSSNSSD